MKKPEGMTTKKAITADIRYAGRYIEKDASIFFAKYADGSTAIVGETKSGEPLITATVNLSAYGLRPNEGEVFIKNYSENEGVLESLIKAGIISKPIEEVPVGHVVAYRVKLIGA